MLYDYFFLYPSITEVLSSYTSTTSNASIPCSNSIYKTEGVSKDETGDKPIDKKDESPDKPIDIKEESPDSTKDKKVEKGEEESFEIEEEIYEIDRLIALSKDANKLDGKLPDSQKDKNGHLEEIRKNPDVKNFFEGRTPNISDLPELVEALIEARKDKYEELLEAKKVAKDEQSNSYSRDISRSNTPERVPNPKARPNSSLREEILNNNTFKENSYNPLNHKFLKKNTFKEYSSNNSDYKVNA
jgi:hypothetical protein